MSHANGTQVEASELPIVCNLSEAEFALRGAEITEDIFSSCEKVEELADGYAFRFPGDEGWAARLLKFVIEERKCCPFFTFDLVFEPQEGPIWLKLRGDERVKLFIGQNFRNSVAALDPNTDPHP